MRSGRMVLILATALALVGDRAGISVASQALTRIADGSRAPDVAPKGVEIGDVDRAAEPCTDFYAFANGSWRAANPIPKGMRRWSRRVVAREENRRQLVGLLEELSTRKDRPEGSVEQQLGDYFGACMNESAVDAGGVSPLSPLLQEIASVQDQAGIQRMIRRLHELAIPAAFAVTALSDYHDPEGVIVNVAAGRLGLPDRDHYLQPDQRFAEAREKYQAHIIRMLTLSGVAGAAASKAAEEILGLEARLAEASLAPAIAADPAATAHKVTFAKLSQLTPRLDWATYFSEAKLPRIDVNVAEPAFIERVNREIDATPVTTWKRYLTWRLLESAAPWLSKPFVDESFAFNDKYLGGAGTNKPRATQCLESTEALLGEALGRKYVERQFPPEAKAKVQGMVRTLLAIFKDDIRDAKWMSPATRRESLAKLDAYSVMVGYPDAWTDQTALVIRRDAFWANVAAARRLGVEADRKRIGQRASRTTWQLPPSSPDAYIDIQLNLMGLPAGFLQAPAFDLRASDAVNYGAIGVGMAHDFTHAIDALGREFDSKGQPRSWWLEADLTAFKKVSQCTVDQYAGYAIEPGVHLNGQLVLGEALGDLAGARLAYRALKRSMLRQPAPMIDGLTPEQQFFVAWGQYRGAAESLELQRAMVKSDPHATARYRVNGPLSNMPEFQQAFACKAGSPMVRSPEKRCGAW
jgi:putative endopeptidase